MDLGLGCSPTQTMLMKVLIPRLFALRVSLVARSQLHVADKRSHRLLGPLE